MTKTKLPKGWTETHSYRCYVRSFGPLTCRVVYSSWSDRFKVQLVVNFDSVVATLFNEYQPDAGESEADTLRKMTAEAQRLIRKWSK